MRREVARRGNGVEPYSRVAIFERDRWVCQLCEQPIDPSLAYPDPMAASIDHTLPISLGGPDAAANVRASHLLCNIRRGARLTA